jgi:hypothetical protein
VKSGGAGATALDVRAEYWRTAVDLAGEVAVAGACMRGIADGEPVPLGPAGRAWPGDIVVTLGADGRPLVHRLLGRYPGRRGWMVVTAADHALVVDAPVPASQLVARVARPVPPHQRMRAVGALARYLLRRAGRALAAATTVA